MGDFFLGASPAGGMAAGGVDGSIGAGAGGMSGVAGAAGCCAGSCVGVVGSLWLLGGMGPLLGELFGYLQALYH